jgi:membrane AbrB-like protein
MIAAIGLSLSGRTPAIPSWPMAVAPGFIGVLVARAITADFFQTLGACWPYLLGGTFWTIAVGALLSLALLRLGLLPSASAFWCLSPGGATVMVIVSGKYGGDMSLVAFTQYFRVILVSFAAAAVSSVFLDVTVEQAQTIFFPPLELNSLAVTLLSVFVGLASAHLVRFSSGNFLFPMCLAALMQNLFNLPVFLPPWLLYACYALVGWRIGCSFSCELMRKIIKLIPVIFVAVLLMIIGCGLFSVFMASGAGVEPITAYLAACPGGLDAVTIIAVSSGADLSFVMVMQAMRLIAILFCGPYIYGLLTKRFAVEKMARKP